MTHIKFKQTIIDGIIIKVVGCNHHNNPCIHNHNGCYCNHPKFFEPDKSCFEKTKIRPIIPRNDSNNFPKNCPLEEWNK